MTLTTDNLRYVTVNVAYHNRPYHCDAANQGLVDRIVDYSVFWSCFGQLGEEGFGVITRNLQP